MDFPSSLCFADESDARPATVTQRQRQILEFVNARGYATIEMLAEAFSVSMQTVRRDIIQLDKANVLQRFHGGAGVRDQSVRMGYARKSTQQVAAKALIGAAAAELVPEQGSVYLDVGTTAEAVARALIDRRPRMVVTNSMPAALIFASQQEIEVVVTGGSVRGADGSLTGDAATRTVSAFKVDVAVIACSGFDEDGAPMDFDLGKTAVKQAAIATSRQAILVAHSDKFKRQALIRVAPPTSFSALVTERLPQMETERAICTAGYRIVCAGQASEDAGATGSPGSRPSP